MTSQVQHNLWVGSADDGEDVLEPSRKIIDPHHHLWNNHPERTHIADYLAAELVYDIKNSGHNVVATVYVQSSSAKHCWPKDAMDTTKPYLDVICESEFAQSFATTYKTNTIKINAGIIATCNLELPTPQVREVLHHHQQRLNFRGVRYLGGHAEQIDFDSPQVNEALGILSEMGLTFDVNGPETHPLNFDKVLGGIAKAAMEHPSLQVIVNHCGGAVGPRAFTDVKKREEWERHMRRLAAIPNVCCKVGGLQMPINGYKIGPRNRPTKSVSSMELAEMTFEIYSFCIRLFGSSRCMFESNFPVDKFGASYKVVWNCFKRVALIIQLTDDEKNDVFHDTARRIYKL